MEENAQLKQIVASVLETIIDAVNLQHLDRSTVNEETPLTQGGPGLDSVDVLEIVVAVEHEFGVKVGNPEAGKKYFRTLGTVADLVQSR
ncbi:MAG: acyl carrier protein [Methylotenera sp.]|nr:acyl carrier protein [Oligoflexia bacterium]